MAHAKGEDTGARVSVVHVNPTKPRPDVEAIKARLDTKDRYLGYGGLAGQHLDALIAYIRALEAQKWDVQHTDVMNDMVALGIDRDSWKARAEALEARQVKLVAVKTSLRAFEEWVKEYDFTSHTLPDSFLMKVTLLVRDINKMIKALAALDGGGDG